MSFASSYSSPSAPSRLILSAHARRRRPDPRARARRRRHGLRHPRWGVPADLRRPPRQPIRHVLMRHEAAAGHAAEGYARASGRIGVAIGTSGPGATNLVTAIADAQMDSTPTLFITGQVKTTLRGTNAFQEADVIGITQPLVKHSISIERADDVAQAVVDAIRIATSGRPGPVLIDLPVDIANAPARDETHEPYLPGYRPRERPNGRQIRRAAEALAGARRPVLYAGGGVTNADAAEELRALAALDRRARDDHADGARRVPGVRPPVARNARHARHQGRELGDGRGRRDRRHRRPLRRPRDRRGRRVRARREDRPHRRRPVGDRQDRHRARAGRGRREAGADARCSSPTRSSTPTPGGSPSGGAGSAAGRRRTRCASPSRPSPAASRPSSRSTS